MKAIDVMNYYCLDFLAKYLRGHKGFVCGGCFKNIFNKEKIKDIDVFFRSEKDWQEAVQYFNSHSIGYTERDDGEPLKEDFADYRFYYENAKVKAYKDLKTGMSIELCRAIFGSPEQIINQFDFTITKFAYYIEDETDDDGTVINTHKCICHDDFFEHLHNKRLVTDDKIPFPMSTFERMIRYIKYGYMPCKETKIKIALAINELNQEQIEVSKSLYDGMD